MPKTRTLLDQNDDTETARFRDDIIKQMIATPPTPHVAPKPKRRVTRAKSAKRKRSK